MRWLHAYKSGMWFIAEDDSGDVWGLSSESIVAACGEARSRRANGKPSLSAETYGQIMAKDEEMT